MVAIIVIAVLLVAAVLAYFMSNMFAEMVVHPKAMTKQQCYDQLKEHNSVNPDEVLKGLKQEPFTYHSQFGYDLRGVIVRCANRHGKQKAVILSHGYTGTYYLMLTYGKLYLDLGFDLVLYDHRWHGNSDKGPNAYCTMSKLESIDLAGLAEYIKQFFDADCVFGLQGESMGSATTMQAAPHIFGLSFVVEDCGFSDMRGQMKATLKMFHMPQFPFLQIGGYLLKRKYDLDMDKVRPVDHVADIQVPMLFCHGDNDHFVPTDMVYKVFEAKKDKKEIHIFKGSDHAASIWEHNEEYRKTLTGFLTKYNIF